MKIALDAKRAYHNGTGLGHYSRTLINSLAKYYAMHNYYLCNPKKSTYYTPAFDNVHEINPTSLLHKKMSSLWRSNWVKGDLNKLGIDIYHGLSHEIPVGIGKTKIKTVVTIHDLIHERYPEQYKKIDRKIYTNKFIYACENADAVIAISQQTKQDIVDFYKIDAAKITVCYQSCNPAFANKIATDERKRIKEKYQLPNKYYLSVGSIIERKNLLTICKAMLALGNENTIPLVVIGKGSGYAQQVYQYVLDNNLHNKIIFLSETEAANDKDFINANDFPAIYQNALAMIYPSTFEGFGIPVLEALWSRLPVITSNVSCLPEAAGEGSILINPMDVNAMANAMQLVATNEMKRIEMIDAGWQHANKFTNELCAQAVMNVYESLM
jgi:glycosyltransferase involved in cell wall biosynthesis